VEKSTVPVYTNEWIRRVLHRHGVDPNSFDVVSNLNSCAKALPSRTSCIRTASLWRQHGTLRWSHAAHL